MLLDCRRASFDRQRLRGEVEEDDETNELLSPLTSNRKSMYKKNRQGSSLMLFASDLVPCDVWPNTGL